MPVTHLPELSANPSAIFGEGDLAICNPVELTNGSAALLFFAVAPGGEAQSFTVDLETRKADLALVFKTIFSVDQVAAALAELRNLLARNPGSIAAAEPSAKIGPFLTAGRIRRELQEVLAAGHFYDPERGDAIQTSEIRRFLDRLDDEVFGPESPKQRAERLERLNRT